MVDQEGGRVARLRPPHWRAHPPARRRCGSRAGCARWLTGALIGLDCAAAGFDVVAAPVLDLAIPGAHAVIGDRALGRGAGGGRPAGARAGGRAAGRRRAAGRQACAGPWPRPGGQPSRAAARRGQRPRRRSAAVRLERRPALGHDGAYRLSRLGRRAAGDIVPDRDRGDHPRPDRLRRSSGDRRSGDEGADRRAGRSGACRRWRRAATWRCTAAASSRRPPTLLARLPAADRGGRARGLRPRGRSRRGGGCRWTRAALAAERDRLLA